MLFVFLVAPPRAEFERLLRATSCWLANSEWWGYSLNDRPAPSPHSRRDGGGQEAPALAELEVVVATSGSSHLLVSPVSRWDYSTQFEKEGSTAAAAAQQTSTLCFEGL